MIQPTPKDSLVVQVGTFTSVREKKFKKVFNGLFQDTQVKVNRKRATTKD